MRNKSTTQTSYANDFVNSKSQYARRETSAHRVQARYSDYMYISEVHCIHTVYSLKRHTLVKVVAMGLKQDYPLQSTLSKTDTFGTSSSCPSQRDVRLIERQIEGGKKGRDQH